MKEFYINGELIFKGEYLNEEKNGNGKEYSAFGLLIFEGEYLNGKKWNGIHKGLINNNGIFKIKNGKGFSAESEDN